MGSDDLNNVTRITDNTYGDRDKNMPDWNARYRKYEHRDYEDDAALNQSTIRRKDGKFNSSAVDGGHANKTTAPTPLLVGGGSQRSHDIERGSNNAIRKQTTIEKYSTTEHTKLDKNVAANSPSAIEPLDTVTSSWSNSDVDTNEISDNGQQIAQNSSEYRRRRKRGPRPRTTLRLSNC